MVRLLQVLMFVSGAIFTGGVSFYAWDRIPAWKTMEPLEYAADFRRSLRRADPTQPIFLATWGSATVAWALQTSEASPLAWVALATMLTVMIGSIVWAEPINTRFRGQPPDTAPPHADQLRVRWFRLHIVRTILTIVAFVLVVVESVGTHGWLILMLTSGGLFGGLAFWYAWDRVVIWRDMPAQTFIPNFRRSIRRADPTQPILLATSLLSGIAFALHSSGSAQTTAIVGLAGLATIGVVSALVIVPIQKTFSRQPLTELLPRAIVLRERWAVLHTARTTLALVSVGLLALASSTAV